MVKADWKSVKELREDIAGGKPADLSLLVLDLRERVDELQTKIAKLEWKLDEKNSN